jgi:hypothetical protein
MSDLLSAVLRKVEELPRDRQDEVAQTLLSLLENERAQYRLTDRQMQEVDVAIASADAGEFSSEEDIVRALHTPWA